MTHQTDLLVIGAGILGLSHAYAAAKRGLKVKVFERSATPLGASVRNFGWRFTGVDPAGPMLDLARQSRDIWGHWAQAAGIQLKRNGSYLFARTEAEEHLLEAFCAGRAQEHGYHVELLQGAALNDLYGGQFRHHRAALHGRDDQQLYSREAIPALINYLSQELKVEFHFSTLVRDVEPGQLHSTSTFDYPTLNALAAFVASRSSSAPGMITKPCWPMRWPPSTRASAACKCCARGQR